jgi:hypothetical protein
VSARLTKIDRKFLNSPIALNNLIRLYENHLCSASLFLCEQRTHNGAYCPAYVVLYAAGGGEGSHMAIR